jgi:hypothetical protein
LANRLADPASDLRIVVPSVASTKVVCDGPGDEWALHVEAATA